ncbi:hypothetical protein VXS02_09720 [Photobacterium piscicola]|uniref:Lipoprotein n=1 Tax=Photobacterium piscicola TaxID=1378299 RepID=A0A1T5HWS5_9GAMM|nr:hypothetical protein [Photobacterium piscicola]MEC6823707.1 hypothetical protein [Photobacterium piscicola]MEC6882087.1 hypothetical protein [Photobacterium piscicola]MEC6899591.1 hypothetical protein [Photobacterium piscicola]SKC31213.1 hypothetical protein CZ809_00691 [Photobacterium piscicola]
MRYSWAIVGMFALLSGCSSSALTSTSSATTAVKETATQTAKPLTLNQQFIQHGYNDGCKDALKNQWQPSKTILDDLKGVEKMKYIEGWKKGYQRCVIGLGPVIINDTMPISHQKK